MCRVFQTTFNPAQTDLEDAQVSAILTVNEMSLPIFDHAYGSCDQPNVEQCDRQGQSGKAQEIPQAGASQVKAMAFPVTEHLFNPHASGVSLQGGLLAGQVGGQQPGFLLAFGPIGQQVGQAGMSAGQGFLFYLLALSRPTHQRRKILPIALVRQANLVGAFLPQNIVPLPFFQLGLNFARFEFGVAHQQHRHVFRQQLAHIGQQSQLHPTRRMTAPTLAPRPGNGDRSAAKGQADDQQTVAIAYLGAIPDQADFTRTAGHRLQPCLSNRFIPTAAMNGWVVNQIFQTPTHARFLRRPRYLLGNFLQLHRFAGIDPGHEPGKRRHSVFTFFRTQLLKFPETGMIEPVDRQRTPQA